MANHKCADAKQMIDVCRKIVANCQMERINGTSIDLYTASAIVKVHDGLNETNRAKLYGITSVSRLANISMRLVA